MRCRAGRMTLDDLGKINVRAGLKPPKNVRCATCKNKDRASIDIGLFLESSKKANKENLPLKDRIMMFASTPKVKDGNNC